MNSYRSDKLYCEGWFLLSSADITPKFQERKALGEHPEIMLRERSFKKIAALKCFKRNASRTTVYNVCCQSARMGAVIQQNNFK
jgi:hypothetical protein